MKVYIFILIIVVVSFSCGTKHDTVRSLKDKYQKLDTLFTQSERFNDSICQIATDSASRRFKKNRFELYAFLAYDSSETPIHILQQKFRLHVIGFAEKDILFRFCFNERMIMAFEEKNKFNPIDSAKALYDSLDKIGLTNIPEKFGTKEEDLYKYMTCNLEFPFGTDLMPPYPFVRIRFRISPSGKADSIKITKSFSSDYDSAVLKLVRMMPKWRPRRDSQGEYAPVYIEYSVRFTPMKDDKYCAGVQGFQRAQFLNDHRRLYLNVDSLSAENALKNLNALIAKYPNYHYNYYLKGQKLMALKRYHEAIAVFDQTIAIEPNFRYAYAEKALAQYMLGDKDRACKAWKTSQGGGTAYYEKYCKSEQ